ncbi:family 16 glycosylhydrolase [Gilvimarinus xylanilyticus]|uniref:Family 16 glycosylhydrolase n=1 Tax=Gilvimarinus xylanilyticus TaxID=2944139 RepID=A0A9X2I3Z8_9GAMM|nr:glycoside hydrolase family 16 protein [Gilvimarinus xylanilyticus]MCP8899945.1 family 16 glycosylhydrolase [Gilvimarinus xylanilyticus]
MKANLGLPFAVGALTLTLTACGGNSEGDENSSSIASSVVSSSAGENSSSSVDNSSESSVSSSSVSSSVSSVTLSSSDSSSSVSSAVSSSSVSSTSSAQSSSSNEDSSSSSVQSSSSSSTPTTAWNLVWQDEFEGASIDTTKWEHEVNCWGGGNNEQQCYTDRADNSYVQDGKLHIVARQETFSGPAVNNENPDYDPSDTSATMPFTSARLRTRNKADWTYGRMEINAKLPQGDGLWPAIWMLPTDSEYGGWPLSGEIDIMEAVNPNAGGGNITHGTLHYGQVWPGNLNTGSAYTPPANVWEEFHTYAIEWEQGEIRWYVDDVHFATQTQDDWFTYYWGGQEHGFQLGAEDAPFDQNFHLLLNVAVGGNWPGAPDGTASFPQAMEVDYVRVYECSADPVTGKGCATVDPGAKDVTGAAAPTPVSVDLYNAGPASFTFNTVDGEVTNTLVPGFYDNGTGNVISTPDATDAQGNTVWDVEFNGPGNVFLSSGDMSAHYEVNDGLKFTNVADYGELRFSMLVQAIDPTTELQVKLDSVWPNVSFHAIDVPTVGEWTQVSVAINQLAPNNIESGEANLGQLVNAFVLEASGGTAHVQLADIQLNCLSPCGVDPVLASVSDTLTEQFDIFANGMPGANWDFGVGTWDNNSGRVSTEVVNDVDRGDVLDINFAETGENGLAFIQSTTTKNARAFASNGKLRFDIKVLDYGTNTGGIVVKAESGPGVSTGDYVIERVPEDVWTTLTIDIADLLAAPGGSGFNIDAFNTPFVILPAWNDQGGVHLRVDNIEWIDGSGSAEPSIDALEAPFTVYDQGAPGPEWDFGVGKWDNDTGHVGISTVADSARGNVLQLDFSDSGNNGLAFVQSTQAKDLSAFASDGQLVFDLKVLDFGSNTQGLVVKLESGPGVGTGDYVIHTPIAGVWTEYTIDIADLLGHTGTHGDFDISAMNTPFTILPVWGDQAGVQLQLDNVRWVFETSTSSSSSSSSSSAGTGSSSSSSESFSSISSSSSTSSEGPSSSSSSSSSTDSTVPETLDSGWELVWNDEFNGTDIDGTKWEHEVNCWGGGNNEAQCYTDDSANSYVEDSLLHIAAIYEPGQVCGPATNQEDPNYNPADTSVCKDYSSARLRTRGKADWQYGRMEIRAKMPQGVGVWPALWMLPSDNIYGAWPHSGEIDIFEAFQPGVSGPAPTGAANEMHGTLHYGFAWPWNQYSGAGYEPPTNIWDDFYTYAVEWEEGEIRWYVDDVLFARNTGNWFIYYWGGQEVGYQVGEDAQPFDQAFHMLLNVALGNGEYIDLPTFTDTRTMTVDYVRVYECAHDPVTGKGCESAADDRDVTNIVGHLPPADARDELVLYSGADGGIQTLSFDVNGTTVQNPLQYAEWNDSGALASNPSAAPIDDGSGSTTVWDLQFNNTGAAVAWLASDAMSSYPGVEAGFNFGSDPLHNRPRNLGEFKFDIWVEAANIGSKLVVKLGSGFPDLSIEDVDLTADMVGKWTPVSVRFYSLRQAEGSWSQVDWSSVMRPIELELLGGAAHIQLDNIRIACLEDCAIEPKLAPVTITDDMDVFVNGLAADWGNPGFGVWQAEGQIINLDATVTDADKGTVLQAEFTQNNMGTFYIQDAAAKDLSAFANGNLVFDLKVVSNSGNSDGFLVKVESTGGNSSNEVPVPLPAGNDWTTISVPFTELANGAFDLEKVNTPFSMWPVFGQQQVTFQIANLRWELPD